MTAQPRLDFWVEGKQQKRHPLHGATFVRAGMWHREPDGRLLEYAVDSLTVIDPVSGQERLVTVDDFGGKTVAVNLSSGDPIYGESYVLAPPTIFPEPAANDLEGYIARAVRQATDEYLETNVRVGRLALQFTETTPDVAEFRQFSEIWVRLGTAEIELRTGTAQRRRMNQELSVRSRAVPQQAADRERANEVRRRSGNHWR